jgi:hypothetical protein
MRFTPTLGTDQAPLFFDRFVQIIGPEPWQKRYRILIEQVRANPLLRDFVARRHDIEVTIGRLLENRTAGGSLQLDISTPTDYAALSFIAPVVMIYEGLSPTGKVRVAGILRDGLNTDRGLRPFQNEIETATHLAHAGFDVTFRDLEGEPGFDFLAVRDGAELEVECKSVSGDLGRQVHERVMAELSNRILRRVKEVVNGLPGGHLIRVTLPARLPAEQLALETIAAGVQGALTESDPASHPACEIHVRTFDVAASPFAGLQPTDLATEDVRRFVEEQTGLSNVSTFVLFSPGRHAIVVVVDSQKRDRVVGELVRHLKEAAKDQFSRTRPAVLVVQFLELPADAMLELSRHDSNDPAKASALQLATNLFLNSPGRSHIHSVVYRSHGTLTSEMPAVQEQGPTYFFTNPAHPQAADPRYRPFAIEAT